MIENESFIESFSSKLRTINDYIQCHENYKGTSVLGKTKSLLKSELSIINKELQNLNEFMLECSKIVVNASLGLSNLTLSATTKNNKLTVILP